MKTLIALTALALSAHTLADDSRSNLQDGKGLYPQWLISHDG